MVLKLVGLITNEIVLKKHLIMLDLIVKNGPVFLRNIFVFKHLKHYNLSTRTHAKLLCNSALIQVKKKHYECFLK